MRLITVKKETKTTWDFTQFIQHTFLKTEKKDSSNKVYVKTKHKREAVTQKVFYTKRCS